MAPGRIILGELGGIETGVRQLIRTRPLEVRQVRLESGALLTVPTPDEILRIKAYLIVKRNQVRDYLDVAALSARYGTERAASVLARIDDYYADSTHDSDSRVVRDQLLRQLALPQPRDSRTTGRLSDYKGLVPRWREWDAVAAQCALLADAIMSEIGA